MRRNNLIKVLFIIVGEVGVGQATIPILFGTNNTIQIDSIKKQAFMNLEDKI